jgi:MSHA biogenesis protein MshP
MMHPQKGITLIGAIFVLVIVSMLGTYLVKVAGVQRQSVISNLLSARAYQAANAGLEWSLSRIINQNSCVASTTLSDTVDGFTVHTSCSALVSSGYDEAGTIINIYKLSSRSELGTYGSTNYITRELETIVHGP